MAYSLKKEERGDGRARSNDKRKAVYLKAAKSTHGILSVARIVTTRKGSKASGRGNDHRCDSLVNITNSSAVPLNWLVSTHWPITVGRADCTWQVEIGLGAQGTSPSEVLIHENANAKSSLQSPFKIRLHDLFSASGQRNF